MNSEISNYLKASNFGFSIPTGAVINGIQVSIERRRVTGAGIIIQDNVIEIVSGASTSSDNKASINAWPTSDGVASYGSASDTWGNSWTPAQINDPTFGVLIAVQRTDVTGGNHSAYVDYISVTVTYTIIPTSILTITPAVGTYGATTSLTSTLSPALAGKTISFSLNGSLIGSTTTDSGGVATLSNASLIGINVGDYPAGISASFAGDGDGLASSDTASLTVDKRDITVTAVADSKIYDGEVISVKIPTITSGNLVGTDSVTWAQTFDDKNVGTSKILTPAGVVSDGNGGDNYTVTFLPDPTGVITVKDLTVSATGVNKIYDSFSTASVTLSDDRVANDILTDNYASASFADKNVGVGKTVSVTGISISGADAGNYNLLNTTASPTADITAKDLVVTATGINKVFDENTNAEVTLANNALVGDIITSSYTSASFDDATSSANKPVHVIGIVVAGTDAGNYTLISPTAETTASITPNGATISLNKASLSRPYTGSPQEITVDSTGPSGLSTVVFYNGSP
ncbi:MAG: YDG domain-containing protein, partial [Candidatus Vogelbacteria bacterium]|nr:YDG domain-containing protein [Candidatus Vogelbacteria bacterium]